MRDDAAVGGFGLATMNLDHDAPRRLAVCRTCLHNYVVPLDGVERDEGTWWLELRCGWCGAHRAVVASDEEAWELCDEVDRGLARLAAAADRLQRLELISSEDFGQTAG